ncbi:MAG: hypothetical protein ACUVUG_02765 [Candidatus Aminicenantia bacterium]
MENLSERLRTLRGKLEELIIKYENYFSRIEKEPPTELHKEVAKGISSFMGRTAMNISQQFLFNQILQRFRTYEALWEKMKKKIEEEIEGGVKPVSRRPPVTETKQFFKFSTESKKEELEKLYKSFVESSAKAGIPKMPYSTFEKYILNQINTIKNKFPCSSVIVWVEKEGDKPKIKAKPE